MTEQNVPQEPQGDVVAPPDDADTVPETDEPEDDITEEGETPEKQDQQTG